MAMLVNTNAALKTVKGKMKQLFILKSQVNVNFCLFQFLFSFSSFFFRTFTFFELYF